MTTILHFSRASARSTRCLFQSRSQQLRSHFYTSPALRCTPASRLQLRCYSQKTSKDQDDDSNGPTKQTPNLDESSKHQGQEQKAPSTPGKAAPGFEGLYQSKFLSRPPENESQPDRPLEPGWRRVTAEDEVRLKKVSDTLNNVLPESMKREWDTTTEIVKKYGIPKELDELMEKMEGGKPPALSDIARCARLAQKLSLKLMEMEDKGKAGQKSEQKDEGKDEGSRQSQEGQQGGQNRQSSQDGSSKGWGGWFAPDNFVNTTITVFISYLFYSMFAGFERSKDITFQEFRTSFLDKGLVEKLVVLNHTRVKVYLHREAVRNMYPESPAVHGDFYYYFTVGSVEAFERSMDEAQRDLGIPNAERIPISYSNPLSMTSTLVSFGPTLLFLGFLFWMSRRAGGGGSGSTSGIFGMGRSRAKRFNHETDVKTKFADVAGMDEAKQEIMEFVEFLRNPEQFQRLGAKIPRGALLSGPPGTGKTLLAKATAGESRVPFFSVSGSEFVEMFVGVGPSRVRDLFANARKNTPCIIFIDEIDAIGKSRSKQGWGGGNDERDATLNQILTEMDGFNTTDQVVVLAGTNRPDVLDAALLRPGRFDRHISIDRPTMEGRKQIFRVHLRKIITDEDMDYLTGRLAALTPGFSGADIANCCNEAALIAARQKATKVEMTHFEQAIERTIGGLEKKSLVLSPEEKKTVAYHEAGHAICGWFFKWADPLLKVSIIPRGQGALGYAQYLPGDVYLMTVNQLMDRMAMTLGGRVSEELHFDTVTSGASDDFNKVTRMATAMVTKWGMSPKIGYLHFEEDERKLHKPFSEETAREIDAEVRRIVDQAYKQCKDLLVAKKKEVGVVAEELLKKEMLVRDDMIRLLGPRPFEDRKEFEQYFGGGEKSAPPPPPSEPPASDGPRPDPALFERHP